jgi:ABC-type polar amino acid transport system ATPase subunit
LGKRSPQYRSEPTQFHTYSFWNSRISPLFEHRSGLGNLMLGAMQKERDSKIARDKVTALLKEFELEDKFNLYPA